MSYDVSVEVNEAPYSPFNIVGYSYWDCSISYEGRSMTTTIATPETSSKPTEEEALIILAKEGNMIETLNTQKLFEKFFQFVDLEPDMVSEIHQSMQEKAQQFRYVLGDILYRFYVGEKLIN